MLYIGNHTSSSRGYLAMGKQMLANGGNTFAFFTRNPRGGKAKDIDPQDVQAFGQLAEENHCGKLVAHAPYTMNCCAAKENLRDFAREIMADDLRRLEMTPGNYYNFHPGSHTGLGVEKGIEYIIELLNEIMDEGQTTRVLLEGMSGKGSEIGSKFEELAAIIDGVKLKERIGVCLDTCHLYEAGYD
ncbi:MAG: deoxyribonuclease IV, partial [Blautia wexlerae]